MLTSEYFRQRWSWYRPVLSRGDDPAKLSKVNVRRMPIRMTGEDANEFIPYAVESKIEAILGSAVRRLYDYTERYMIKGEKVSAHQLPQSDAVSRLMIRHMRELYPHLPQTLLHHWCADQHGGVALLTLWQNLWKQSWKQDQADSAPWVVAVNVLMLKLLRMAISKLPSDYPEYTDHVMLRVVGGLYHWALQNFLKNQLEGVVEVTRISTYESMIIPATPVAFLYQQPNDALLFDDRKVILSYGLEPDIVPRMHEMRAKLGPKNEAGMMALLGKDRMGDHLLKRTWVRLCLQELAEKSGVAAVMELTLDSKSMDRFISRPDSIGPVIVQALESNRDMPFAAWCLAQIQGGRAAEKAGSPWQRDDRTLMAYRVFDEDIKVERARRESEKSWGDRHEAIASKGRKGPEADKLFLKAYEEGKIVYLQTDTTKSLHSGTSLAARQACLKVDWSDYLAGMSALSSDNAKNFLQKTFLPSVIEAVYGRDGVYPDECSASGCMLRGDSMSLFNVGVHLRKMLRDWYRSAAEGQDKGEIPAVSMCMSMVGDWSFVEIDHARLGKQKLTFGMALVQAASGVSRDCGVGRLIAFGDQQAKKKPLGGVRVESLDAGGGQIVHVLCNNGFALTASAVADLTGELGKRAKIREYRHRRADVQPLLPQFRITAGRFDLITVQQKGAESEPPDMLLYVGQPCLAGVDVDMYELLEKDSDTTAAIMQHCLPIWGR